MCPHIELRTTWNCTRKVKCSSIKYKFFQRKESVNIYSLDAWTRISDTRDSTRCPRSAHRPTPINECIHVIGVLICEETRIRSYCYGSKNATMNIPNKGTCAFNSRTAYLICRLGDTGCMCFDVSCMWDELGCKVFLVAKYHLVHLTPCNLKHTHAITEKPNDALLGYSRAFTLCS